MVVDFVDEVDGGSAFALASFQHGAVDVHAEHALAAEFWEQGRVDVEDAVAVAFEDAGADLFHVSSEDYEFDACVLQGLEDGLVELGEIWVGLAVEHFGGHPGFLGAVEGFGSEVVADQQARGGGDGFLGASVEYGLHV